MAAPTSSDWTDVFGVILPPFAFALFVPAVIIGAVIEKTRRRKVPLDRAGALQGFIDERARANPQMYRFYLENRPKMK